MPAFIIAQAHHSDITTPAGEITIGSQNAH
jgi:hypothetical protein